MARWLTPLRAGLISLFAGVLLGVALSRPERARAVTSGTLPETRQRIAAERLAVAAVDEWRTAVIVDSVRSSLAGSAASPWMVTVDAGVPEWIADGVRAAAERARSSITAAPGAPRVSIALVLDTLTVVGDREVPAPRPRRGLVDHVVSSHATDPCLIIFRVGRRVPGTDSGRAWYLAGMANEIPGTCGIVAAFGAPGPGITEWLRRTNGDFARAATWQLPTPKVVRHSEYSIRDMWWPSADEYAPREMGCLAGRVSSCTSWLDTTNRAPAQFVPGGFSDGRGNVVVGREAGSVQHYKNFFISDLIRTRGSDKFASMWTSDRAFPDAFQATYGEPAGRWAARWHRDIGFPVPVELRSPWRGAPLSLLVAVLFVGGAMGYATRRRAGGG